MTPLKKHTYQVGWILFVLGIVLTAILLVTGGPMPFYPAAMLSSVGMILYILGIKWKGM